MQSIQRDTMIDGRYRVLNRLGSGGMADVYCAEDTQLGRRVALKLLYRRFAEDEEFVERFRREASSAAGLQHPNIVGIFDRGEWDGTYYIAMEFIDGHTLKQLVREHGAMPPDLAIDITVQVLRAARFAHKRGVVHRDFKPHNVIARRGGPRQGHRLRDRARRRLGHDRDRLDHGHRAVPLARAGAGPAGQPALRPLLDRRDALRAADRPGAVRRRVAGDDRAQARLRAPDPARRAQPGRRPGARRGGHARAREGPRSAGSPTPTSSSPRCEAAREQPRRRGQGDGARAVSDAGRAVRRRGAPAIARGGCGCSRLLLLVGAGDRRVPAARAGEAHGARRGRRAPRRSPPSGCRTPASRSTSRR